MAGPIKPSPRSNGDIDFAAELSARTRSHHKRSDNAVRLAAPFALSSPRAYRLLLLAFYRVYAALETELDARRRVVPRLSVLHFSALQRTRAFEADLVHYYGSAEAFRAALAEACAASPQSGKRRRTAVDDYIDTMRAAARDDPVLLIAYVHSLYLALLAGGAVLQQWLVRAFGLTPPRGVAIFTFDAIPDRAKFRRDFADAINSIPLSRAERDRIVAHKRAVFAANDTIFRHVVRSHAYRRVVLQTVLLVALALALLVGTWHLWAGKPLPLPLALRA